MENENKNLKQWYAVTTFIGREEKAKVNLENRIKFFGLEDFVDKIVVAEEKVPSIGKNGQPVMKKNKETGVKEQSFKTVNFYPGYVFVEMDMTDTVWYIVRNTPEVTGITGSSGGGQKPTPITEKEIEAVLKRVGLVDANMYENYHVGDIVKIIHGTFNGVEGKIMSIDKEAGTVKVDTIFFGRHTPVDVEFTEIVHGE